MVVVWTLMEDGASAATDYVEIPDSNSEFAIGTGILLWNVGYGEMIMDPILTRIRCLCLTMEQAVPVIIRIFIYLLEFLHIMMVMVHIFHQVIKGPVIVANSGIMWRYPRESGTSLSFFLMVF